MGGVVGALIAAGGQANVGVNMSQSVIDEKQFTGVADEYEHAYYNEAENPQKASVFVIYIDAEIKGKRVFVRTVAPFKGQQGQNSYGLAVESTVQYYLAQYQPAVTPVPAPVAAAAPVTPVPPAPAPSTAAPATVPANPPAPPH